MSKILNAKFLNVLRPWAEKCWKDYNEYCDLVMEDRPIPERLKYVNGYLIENDFK